MTFDDVLRDATEQAILQIRALLRNPGPLPPALDDKRCPRCSLLDACVPATVAAARARRQAEQLYQLPAETGGIQTGGTP